ncbi:unnamed protein product [Symbiodinium sp. CCMP2456]|nr:unnamed protein product [Symbiodinium sp. CCMP2456]
MPNLCATAFAQDGRTRQWGLVLQKRLYELLLQANTYRKSNDDETSKALNTLFSDLFFHRWQVVLELWATGEQSGWNAESAEYRDFAFCLFGGPSHTKWSCEDAFSHLAGSLQRHVPMIEPSTDDYRAMRAERQAGKSRSSTDPADLNYVQGTAFRLQTASPTELKLSSLLQEIGRHYCFLQPLVKEFPDRVPSGFLLTDVWLRKNDKRQKGLVKPKQGETVWDHAAKEAKRIKKLMGSLRYLFRNGNEDANLMRYHSALGWGSPCELSELWKDSQVTGHEPDEGAPEDETVSGRGDDDEDSGEESGESEELDEDPKESESSVDDAREGYSGHTADTEVPVEFEEGLAAEREDALNCRGAAGPAPSTDDSDSETGEHLSAQKTGSEAVVAASPKTPPAGSDPGSSPAGSEDGNSEDDEGSSQSLKSPPKPLRNKSEHTTLKTPPPAMPAWMNPDEVITPPPVPAPFKKGGNRRKVKKGTKDGRSKATFGKRGKKRAAQTLGGKDSKKAKHEEPPANAGPRRAIDLDGGNGPYFKEHSLSWVPVEARPEGDLAKHKGNHSYTVTDGEAKVEILLRQKAFYVKQARSDAPGPKGQISVGKYSSVAAAWDEAKARSGLNL